MVPAAVVSIGKSRGSVSAAMTTALYPQIVPMDDSASMLCARVVRGMSSMEKDVTPVAASFWSVSSGAKGRRKPIRYWSGRTSDKSASPVRSLAPAASTCTMTPAVLNTSARPGTIVAPFET
jgi:hypothetical protein